MLWKLHKRLLKFLARYMLDYRLRRLFLQLAGYKVGQHVFIGEELIIKDELEDRGMVSIGDRVAIADRVTLVASSHPNFSRLRNIVKEVHEPITIEDDAWIGACAIIFPGIRVGKGAIVGAGAVVTKSVADATVVAGNPARPIKVIDFTPAEPVAKKKVLRRRSA